MEWQGEHYLITVDGWSDFFDISKLGITATTTKIISITERLSAVYGRPRQFRTDSDPRYRSHEFRFFLDRWKLTHRASAPHNHSANGKAESGVKVAKRILKKSLLLKQDLHLALLEWRNTPQRNGLSPNEKFLNRRTRSMLPASEECLQPKIHKSIEANIVTRRKRQKLYHDRGVVELPELAVGDVIQVAPQEFSQTWLPTRVGETESQNLRGGDRGRVEIRQEPEISAEHQTTYKRHGTRPARPSHGTTTRKKTNS